MVPFVVVCITILFERRFNFDLELIYRSFTLIGDYFCEFRRFAFTLIENEIYAFDSIQLYRYLLTVNNFETKEIIKKDVGLFANQATVNCPKL